MEQAAETWELLDELSDIIRWRPDEHSSDDTPLDRRGWTEPLIHLSNDQLTELELAGPAHAIRCDVLPPSLRQVAERIRSALATVPDRPAPPPDGNAAGRAPAGSCIPGIRPRKAPQVAALEAEIRALRGPPTYSTLVELGAGRGALARSLARSCPGDAPLAEQFIAVERDARLATTGRNLNRLANVRFEAIEAADWQPMSASRQTSEIVVGLHACGALSDVVVQHAAERRADVALVACCPQKIDNPTRLALSAAAQSRLPNFPRAALGLANLQPRAEGVEVSHDVTMAAREKRVALRALLGQRGIPTAPGNEMRGLNRRYAHRAFGELAAAALARRGLQPPTDHELSKAERLGAIRFARQRRLTLPRAWLAPVLELGLSLDRAAYLEERGYRVELVRFVPSSVTPRNLLLLGRPHR